MYWWIEQMKVYVPGEFGAVKVLDCPADMSPVSNPPFDAVIVWAT